MTVAVWLSGGCSHSGPQPPLAAPEGKNWTLAFDVEFDGANLDSSKLTPCFDWNFGDCTSSFNLGLEHYVPEQVRLSDGIAHLQAQPLNPVRHDLACFDATCSYKSGLLSTARPNQNSPYLFSFTYGYAEARLKLPNTQGMFTSFWMVPAQPNYVYNSEIDILENLAGKPDVIYQSYHYDGRSRIYKVNDPSRDSNGLCTKRDYSLDFHTYGVDWEPDHVAFYIDGAECGRFTPTASSQIGKEPMQLIVALMVDIKWQRDVNLRLSSQKSTDELQVDYIRVWQPH